MIIKCKMCGGDIQFNPGDTNGQCDHCGCTTTFPKLPDEQRTNLFNRANHFRRQCEFDKAMAAYEHILEEDDTDAEAHWGIVLSKFGIEYVEDPVTHERIPTCHRAQVISILSDEDYQNALKYAPDTYSREIYEKEAKRIAEIQKGILAISSKEKPYDVFICYKETDDSGNRTKDSTLAQEIYYQLTNEGYKVFFSRITLEDKLGQEYEPYIFAALNSAKVMLVVGTRPEFFNAVWVKNEWNRYLALMKNDRKRVLIPCYRDMDPYDLPEELSSLQSQDMGKIGFLQDIIHGVKKVLGTDKQSSPNVMVQAAGPGVASLHKRAVLFLEDNDWDSATEYFDRILDIDPEYAPAYIGKVQVKNKVRREADLARCREPISNDPDFQKAVRFADEKQKAIYNGYNRAILDRIELERKEAAYREAVALENRAAVEADFLAAAKKYDSAGDIRDAKDRAANCRAKASSAKAEAEKAAAVYREQMERERRERARQEEERRLAEEMRRAEEAERQRKEEELRKEKRKQALKVFAVITAVAMIITGGYLTYDKVIQPKIKYDQAQTLMNEGKLDEAYAAFSDMLDYGDSATKLLEINYKRAEGFLTAGQLTEAKQYYGLAYGYSDSAQQINKIDDYEAAETDYWNNDLVSAGEKYHALGDFLDSSAKYETVSETLYDQAKTALDSKDYEQAFSILTTLGDYSDCQTLIANVDSEYETAMTLWDNGEKLKAEQSLQSLIGWRDVNEKLMVLRLEIADDATKSEDYDTALTYYGKVPRTKEIDKMITSASQGKAYQEAVTAFDAGELETAHEKFVAAGEHKDAAIQAAALELYQQASEYMNEGEYKEARNIYMGLGNYLSSTSNLAVCNAALYQEATELYSNGNLNDAYELYTLISGFSDSKEIADKMDSDYQTALDHIEKGERLEAEALLVSLSGWKDVDEKLEALRESIADNAAAAGDYDTAITYYNLTGKQTEEIADKIFVATQGKNYKEAKDALKAGELDIAYDKFTAADDYEDSAEQAREIDAYKQANSLLSRGQYQEAREAFIELGSFIDSTTKLNICNDALYQEAAGMKEQGDYARAYELFVLISGYSDSADVAKKIRDDYMTAEKLLQNGQYDEANAAFLALHNYSDSPTKARECLYQKAESLKAAGSYDDAIAVYSGLEEYKDSADKINACQYGKAEGLLAGDKIDEAILLFESIPEYSDSSERAQALRYEKAQTLRDSGDLQAARAEYETLGEYSNAPELLTKVLTEIADNSMANKDYASALSAYQGLEQTVEIQEREYKLAQICYDEGHYEEAVSAYETLGQYELSLSKLPIARYAWADQLFEAGEYAKAAEQFSLLGDMTDSATRAEESIYQLANTYLENKEYDVAKSYYASIQGYNDADLMCKECDYRKATDLLNEGKNKEAETIFKALGGYSDSKTKADQCVYNQAEILFANGKFAEAEKLYGTIIYADSATKAKQCVYNAADAFFIAKDYERAQSTFASIDYLDSQDRAKESAYLEADALYHKNKYADAETIFISIAGYKDSDDRAKDCRLQQGVSLMDSGDYQGALEFFESEEYGDSINLAAKCYYELGRASHLAGKTDDAIAKYAFAVSLPEAQEALISMAKDYTVINEPEKAIQALWLVRIREDASNLLIEIAKAEASKEKANNALIAYSSLDQNPSIDFDQLIKCTSISSIDLALDSFNLLPQELDYKKNILYRFALIARDYNYYDLSVQSFTRVGAYEDAREQIKETRYREASYTEKNGDQEKAYGIFISLGEYRDSIERANKPYYELGLSKKKAGKWDEAVAAFEHAGTYSDASEQILATRYDEGLTKLKKEDWDGAYKAFIAAGVYKDASEYAKECMYNKANLLSSNGKYVEAFNIYASLRGFKDVDEIIRSNNKINSTARDLYYSQTFKKDNIISFGRYGNEEIKWRVLERKGDEVLLLSEYIIDNQPLNYESEKIAWEKCSLRNWLNNEFVARSFTEKQKEAILKKRHPCDESQGNPYAEGKAIAGKPTDDKVFLLSYVECKNYNIASKLSEQTEYAKTRGKNYSSSWWLRTTFVHERYFDGQGETVQIYNGEADYGSAYISNDGIGVRPAIWVSIKAKVFSEDAEKFINGR